jgi:hypothetical protein
LAVISRSRQSLTYDGSTFSVDFAVWEVTLNGFSKSRTFFVFSLNFSGPSRTKVYFICAEFEELFVMSFRETLLPFIWSTDTTFSDLPDRTRPFPPKSGSPHGNVGRRLGHPPSQPDGQKPREMQPQAEGTPAPRTQRAGDVPTVSSKD